MSANNNNLLQEVEALIEEVESDEKEKDFYQLLKTLIEFKNNEKVENFLEQYQTMALAMAQGDFSKSMDKTTELASQPNLFGLISETMNMMNVEMDAVMVTRRNFNDLMNAFPSLVLTTDKEGIIVYANKFCQEVLGYEWHDISGKPMSLLLADDFELNLYMNHTAPFPVSGFNMAFTHHSKGIVKMIVAVHPLYDSQDDASGYIYVIQERKGLLSQLL